MNVACVQGKQYNPFRQCKLVSCSSNKIKKRVIYTIVMINYHKLNRLKGCCSQGFDNSSRRREVIAHSYLVTPFCKREQFNSNLNPPPPTAPPKVLLIYCCTFKLAKDVFALCVYVCVFHVANPEMTRGD